jgi:type VI protein secretion system component VasF
MAEIKIERKKGVPVWAILLAIIVLALLAWAFLANRNHTAQNVNNNTAVLQWSAPAPVHAFVPATRCA